MEEVWKDIPDYEGLYQISNFGNVKSISRMSYKRKCETIIKKPCLSGKGYLKVTLCKDGTKKYVFIHRLVAQMFIPNPENKLTVDHIDRNKLNNNVNNLRWATYSEQIKNRCI